MHFIRKLEFARLSIASNLGSTYSFSFSLSSLHFPSIKYWPEIPFFLRLFTSGKSSFVRFHSPPLLLIFDDVSTKRGLLGKKCGEKRERLFGQFFVEDLTTFYSSLFCTKEHQRYRPFFIKEISKKKLSLAEEIPKFQVLNLPQKKKSSPFCR